MASKKTIEIVKSTVPVLQEHGETITKVFYGLLFENNPELKSIFNMTHQVKGGQPRALANAIFQYASFVDQPELLGGVVEKIAQKHSSLSVTKEMYAIVGKNLLEAIKIVLKEAATPEIMEAWTEAYGDLAQIFIQREEGIYTEKEQETGGYRGKQQFVVADKQKESEVITSFYLKRKGGSEVPSFVPGQYIAVTLDIPNTTHQHTRNYSLSDSPNKEYLRISVKKEEGNPNGIASNYLHDHIQIGDELTVGIPAGDFKLKPSERPVVLLGGGVGITPLVSMYKELVTKTNRSVIFIQCALNSKVHAFKQEIAEAMTNNSKTVVVYNEPLESDEKGKDYDYDGLMSLTVLQEAEIDSQSDFYFCGPTPFMGHVLSLLSDFGVAEERINFEFFGPPEELDSQQEVALGA